MTADPPVPDAAVQWRPWPRDPRYLVSPDGVVIGLNGQPLQGTVTPDGHRLISIYPPGGPRESHGVHVAVCETFIGPRPSGMEVAHGNGDPADNRLNNLAWKTPGDNNQDKRQHGTYGKKLTEADVIEIRRLLAAGVSRKELAARYGISDGMVSHIRTGHCWTVHGPSKRRVPRPAVTDEAGVTPVRE